LTVGSVGRQQMRAACPAYAWHASFWTNGNHPVFLPGELQNVLLVKVPADPPSFLKKPSVCVTMIILPRITIMLMIHESAIIATVIVVGNNSITYNFPSVD
jgi:hypothetical protein